MYAHRTIKHEGLCLELLVDVRGSSDYMLRTARCNDAKARRAAGFANLVLRKSAK